MKTLRQIWMALKITVFLFGLVALTAWFAQSLPWYELAGSALLVLAVWGCVFQLSAKFSHHKTSLSRAVGARAATAEDRGTHGGRRMASRGGVLPCAALPLPRRMEPVDVDDPRLAEIPRAPRRPRRLAIDTVTGEEIFDFEFEAAR